MRPWFTQSLGEFRRQTPAQMIPFHDITRPAAEMDALAEFLIASGARPLEALPNQSEPAPDLAQLL